MFAIAHKSMIYVIMYAFINNLADNLFIATFVLRNFGVFVQIFCFVFLKKDVFLDLSHFRPVYAPKDFLEVIVSLRNPNYFNLLDEDEVNWKDHWGLIQVPLEVPTLKELASYIGIN